MVQGVTRERLPVFRSHRRMSLTPVKAVGALLVAAGLVVAGFVGYQVWITDLIAEGAQESLAESLAERSAALVPEREVYVAEALPEAPIELPPEIVLAAPSAAAPALPDVLEYSADPAIPDPVPVAAELPGEELSAPAEPVVITEAPPTGGVAVGRIVIPAADVDWTVVEGVTPADLRMGAGHMSGTALPGEPGNAVISGHRTTYGAPFAHLERLAPGDTITVEGATGVHTYAVVETRVVEPSDVWVTGQWRGAWLTLTTCNPRYSSRERLVVFAHLIDGPNAEVILASP